MTRDEIMNAAERAETQLSIRLGALLSLVRPEIRTLWFLFRGCCFLPVCNNVDGMKIFGECGTKINSKIFANIPSIFGISCYIHIQRTSFTSPHGATYAQCG